MKKTLLNFLWVLLLLGTQAHAQNRTITGTVNGDDGLPLSGVSVLIKGTKSGTQTNAYGKFTINLPAGSNSLVFTFIGFTTKTVTVNGSNVNVVLNSESTMLNDVIIVPYGTAKKETFVGSASSITAKDLQSRQLSNPLNALAGSAPGIQVNTSNGQPGSSPTIRIRGFGSVNASNDPLVIVDGTQYEGSISNINTDDIENMSVLKDASSTALYGAKAANGVIMITTKKGKKSGGQLTIRATTGIAQRGVPEYDRVDAYQYYPLEWQALRNSLVYPASGTGLSIADASMLASGLGTRNANGLQTFGGKTYQDISQTLGSLVVGGVYTQSNNPFNVASNQIVDVNGKINPNAQLRYNDLDWYKPLERTNARQDYGLSYSGANDKTDYYASLGYTNEKGYLIKSDFQRLNARLNINTQATKWFKTGINMSGTATQSNQSPSVDGGTAYVNPIFFARNIGPVYNVYAHNPTTGAALYNADGTQVYDIGGLTALGVPSRASGASPGRHVLEETLLNDNLYKRNLFSVRTYGEISFLKHFKYTTNLSADYSNQNGATFDNPVIGDGAPSGRSSRTTTAITTYNLQEILSYNQSFNKHNFDVTAGHENYSRLYDVLSGSRNTQIIGGNTELVNFTTTSNLTSYKDRDRSEGYFGRLNYDYDQKYLLSAVIRRDATSRFGSDVQWGTFGSVGLGWRVDKEAFMQDVTWVDLLKLRSSYGTVGNYQTLSGGNPAYYLYQNLYDINNNALESGFTQQTTVGNKKLTWEVNKQLDIAIEFGLFKNRINGSVEYYDRKSSNLLFQVPLPVSSGVLSQWQNIGSMYNKGFEVNLSGDPIRTKNFTWTVAVNASTLKNRITKMPPQQPTIVSGTRQLAVGHSIYDFYTRVFAGVDPTDGSSLYVPTDGLTGTTIRTINGVNYTTSQSNAKLMYTGNSSVPKVFGSLTNNFRYKAFDLSFMINYSLGGKIYDSNYQSLMSVSSYGSALHVDALKSWQKPGDITNIPRLDQGNATNLYATSSRWLTNASYMYFRNATLSYNVPTRIANKITVKNARVFVTGENLFLVSARKGLDPSQAYTSNTAIIGSVTNAYVPARILSIGLNVSL